MLFPEVFQSLGNATFQECTSLVQVLFPENITSIGTGTFLDTTNVITLRMHRDIWEKVVATLPEGAERLLVTFFQEPNVVYSRTLAIQRDHYAFYQVDGTPATTVAENELLLLGHGKLTQSQTNAAIDEHVKHYPELILETIYIGQDIESLGPSAISSTTGLKSIKFHPESKVKSIANKGLRNDIGLIELVLPLGIVHVPSEMCSGCKSLPSILIPIGVLTIGHRAFKGCSALPTFVVTGNVTTIVDDAFEDYLSLGSVDLT
jgi:hypothetical protein